MAKRRTRGMTPGEPPPPPGPGTDEERVLLKKWKGRIGLARAHMRRHGDSKTTEGMTRWTRNIRAMAGDFNSMHELGAEAIDVNMIHPTVQTLFAPLWTTDPFIDVEPTQANFTESDGIIEDNVLRAEITEIELNYWFRALEVRQRVGKLALLDAFATNHGYAYLNYILKKEDIQNKSGESTEPDPTVKLKCPIIMRLSPRQVLRPPGKMRLEECEWIAIEWRKPLLDMKDQYGERAKDLKPDETIFDIKEAANVMAVTADMKMWAESDDAKTVRKVEAWDKRTKKIYTLAEGHDQLLEEPREWPADFDGFPVVDLWLVDVPDEDYATPLASMGMPQQKELNASRTAVRMRENRTKAIVWVSGTVPDTISEEYKNAKDATIIRTGMTGDEDINKHLKIDPGLPANTGSYQYGEIQKADMMLIYGVGSQQRSIGDPNAPSATASANLEKWAMVRQGDYGDRLRDFYLTIAKKLWMLLKQFPDSQRDSLVLGTDGQLRPIHYTLRELEGEFEFKMDLSVAMPTDVQTKIQLATTRYNLLRQDPRVNPDRLIDDYLSAQGIRDVGSYMVALTSPDAEFQKALQGLPSQAHERDDHAQHIQLHHAQMSRIDAGMDQIRDKGSSVFQKHQLAMALMLAHLNDHMRIVQALQGQTGPANNRGAGAPMAENLFRASTAQPTAESQAEMAGQQVPPSGPVAPGPTTVQ